MVQPCQEGAKGPQEIIRRNSRTSLPQREIGKLRGDFSPFWNGNAPRAGDDQSKAARLSANVPV